MHNLFWSPVEIEAYNAIVAAHNARIGLRYFAPDNYIQDQQTQH